MARLGLWMFLGGILVGLGSCFGYGRLGGFSDYDHGNPGLKSAFAGLFMLTVPAVAVGFIFVIVGSIHQSLKPNHHDSIVEKEKP
jgi:hypothetical protein